MDQEEGVEISLSASSQAKLQKRLERTNPRMVTALPGNHEVGDDEEEDEEEPPRMKIRVKVVGDGSVTKSTPSTESSLPPEVLKYHQEAHSSRQRFRYSIYALLLFCLTGVIVAIILAAKAGNNNNRKGNEAKQAINNNNRDIDLDSPSITPSMMEGSATDSSSTSAPTTSAELVTTLRAVKSKYEFAEDLTLFYAYGNDFVPDVADWIGIYPTSVVAETGTSNLGDATTFLFTCNQPSVCDSTTSVGQVAFSTELFVQQTSRLASLRWPLDPDEYQAFLLRGLQPPFQVMAASNVFTVNPDFMFHTVVPAVMAIDAELRAAIQDEPHLGPKFVRLGFHDCAGGCDGCVDMTFADNAGLEVPLAVLAPITARHESKGLGISRADIWALSAFVAADIAQERSDTKVDFTMEYVGRKNCEDRFDACFDVNGVQRNCSSNLGPHVELPHPDITSDDLLHFFSEEFDFTVQETVAIMGAHTLGSLTQGNLGFPGPNGWVRDNLLLDHDYYRELMGGSSRDDDLETLIETAPDWFRFDIDNSDFEGIPDRHAWHAFPPAFDGSGTVEIVMLTADVSFNLSFHEHCNSRLPIAGSSHIFIL
jgi:hypothetical protein